MEKIEKRELLSTKEMTSIFGGESWWECTSDTSGAACGDVEVNIYDDNGSWKRGYSIPYECPELIQV